MNERRVTRLRDELMKHAAEFLEQESNRMTMITVTNAELSPDLKRATVFVSIFPTNKEDNAIVFIKRQERDFRSYLAEHARLRRVPQVTFELDFGEKNRQRIDELLRE